jgi:hypothetical protein
MGRLVITGFRCDSDHAMLDSGFPCCLDRQHRLIGQPHGGLGRWWRCLERHRTDAEAHGGIAVG